MDIQKINAFLAKHGSHTLSIERKNSTGLTQGRIPFSQDPFDCQDEHVFEPVSTYSYILGVPVSHISALYCCGEVCK